MNCKCGEEMSLENVFRSQFVEEEYYECENCGQKASIGWIVNEEKETKENER